jgi:hypothetical protein
MKIIICYGSSGDDSLYEATLELLAVPRIGDSVIVDEGDDEQYVLIEQVVWRSDYAWVAGEIVP